MVNSAKKGVSETLQAAGSLSGNGTVLALSPSITKHLVTVKTPAGTYTTGKVQVEAADDPLYAGTWMAIGAELTLATTQEIKVAYDGVLQFIRARISATITGASASVGATYIGQ